MLTSKPSASSTGIVLFLLIAAGLTGCKIGSSRPSTAPIVQCEQAPARPVPPYPTGASCRGTEAERRACVMAEQDAWGLELLGLYTSEVTLRNIEHACLAKHREAGIIQ